MCCLGHNSYSVKICYYCCKHQHPVHCFPKSKVHSHHLELLITFSFRFGRSGVTATSYEGLRVCISNKYSGGDDASAWELHFEEQGSGSSFLPESKLVFKFIAFLLVAVIFLRVISDKKYSYRCSKGAEKSGFYVNLFLPDMIELHIVQRPVSANSWDAPRRAVSWSCLTATTGSVVESPHPEKWKECFYNTSGLSMSDSTLWHELFYLIHKHLLTWDDAKNFQQDSQAFYKWHNIPMFYWREWWLTI